MRKVIMDNGHTVLEVGKTDLPLLGIENKDCKKCDAEDCEKTYYLPLLHKCFCTKCFEAWKAKSNFYPEDPLYEKREFARLGI